jgi:phosphatidylinositol glycan class K
VVNDAHEQIDIYGEDIEVDYRGYEVTVENFIRVLTGRHDPSVPRSKRLLTDDRSNVLIYMTGHGGENFLKFQDAEEISNVELADAFEQMWQTRRCSLSLLLSISPSLLLSFFSASLSPPSPFLSPSPSLFLSPSLYLSLPFSPASFFLSPTS